LVKPLPEREPAFDQLPLGAVQLVALEEAQVSVERPPYAIEVGEAVKVTDGTGQPELAGVVAEQEPLHWIAPELVWPQAFAAEVQAEPYPAGFAGTLALHEPFTIVPVLVWPQAFAAEVQGQEAVPV
jgi:hypothetical protein